VEAMDAAGNTATVTTNTTLDTFPPVLVLTAPADSLLTRDGSVTVRGIVERGATFTISGTVVVPDADGSFSKVVDLIQGKNTITVVATDDAGNRNVQVRTVTMDNMPPAVTILEPKDGSKVTTSQVLVRISADPDAKLYLNGRMLPTKGAVNRTVLLEEGPNLILVKAVDPAGNEGTASVNVILDTRAPTLEITKPTVMEVWTNQVSIEVDGFARGGATGVIVNGVAATFDAASGDFCQTVSQLVSGENNITVVATDGVNQVRQTIKVWLSVARPTLVVDSLSAVITTPTVTITGRTDPGIKTVTVKYSGLSFTFDVNYDGTFAIKLNMPDGPHTVDLSVTNTYGNTATQSSTPFTVKALKIEGKGAAVGMSVQPMGIGAVIAAIGITLAIVAWMVIRATRRR
jgi:hypothetical protein